MADEMTHAEVRKWLPEDLHHDWDNYVQRGCYDGFQEGTRIRDRVSGLIVRGEGA